MTKLHGHDTKHHSLPKNYCFGCGKDNRDGMHLKFSIDEAARKAVCRFKLPRRYWGPPKHAHGGIIATILDEAMGKVNKLRNVIALTSRIEIQYLKPVPLGEPLITEGWEQSVRGRRHINVAEIRNAAGDVLAKGRGVFIAIDPHRKFAKHLPKSYLRRHQAEAQQLASSKETRGTRRKPGFRNAGGARSLHLERR